MAKSDLFYYISLAGVVVLIIWAILKSVGIIQSPVWAEMVPFFSIAIVFGGLIMNVRHIGNSLKEFKEDMKGFQTDTKKDLQDLREKLACIDKDVEVLKDRQKR